MSNQKSIARRYTPRVTRKGRKKEELRKCVEKFNSMEDLSFERVQDKSMHKVAPIPAA